MDLCPAASLSRLVLHKAQGLDPCRVWLVQLEGERQQEAEKAAQVHDEMREAHTRLKRLDKELKQLTTHQVCSTSLTPVLTCSAA